MMISTLSTINAGGGIGRSSSSSMHNMMMRFGATTGSSVSRRGQKTTLLLLLLRNNSSRTATAAAAAGSWREVPNTTTYRWKSTATTNASTSSCPFTGSTQKEDDDTSTQTSSEQHPKLVEIPSLPIVGSFLTSYSGMPIKTEQTTYNFWPEMTRRYGKFYSMGWPGVGKGLSGTTYIIQDPNEMAKILRQEGKFPRGSAEFAWAIAKSLEKQLGPSGSALLKHGPEWKRIRNFLQKDLLSPLSAKQYLPAIIDAAQSSSKGAPTYQDNPNEYLGLVSFEMFSNAMLGNMPNACGNPKPRDKLFIDSVVEALRLNQQLTISPLDAFLVLKLNIKTQKYIDMDNAWECVMTIAREKVDLLKAKRSNGQLSLTEQSCYANQAFDRAESSDDSDVSVEEASMIAAGLLAAAVDTTGGLLSWKLMFLACHSNVQDAIYNEIMEKHNGQITPESIGSSKESPYLYAFIRECHRLRPPITTVPMKFLDNDVTTVHGVTLSKGNVVVLDGYSTGVNEEYINNPYEFQPERFLPDAIKGRKGTKSSIIDHSFFNGPFSQGARKCPGSRVANYETAAILAQLVKDWKFNFTQQQHWMDIPYDLDTVTTAKLPPMEFVPRRN